MTPVLAVLLMLVGVNGFQLERHAPVVSWKTTKQRRRNRLSSPLWMNASLNPSPASITDRMTSKTKKRRMPQNIRPTARFVAISILAEATAAGSFATRELEGSSHYLSLDARDRSFARLLVASVERRLGQIDKVLECCIDKPNKGKHEHVVRATLRAGVAQLLFLHTPPFAAVKETVQVLRMYPSNPPIPEPIIKFVNGVLRKLSGPEKDEADLDDTAEMHGEMLLRERTSPQDNISSWLLDRWRSDWGNRTTEFICGEVMPSDNNPMTSRIDLSTKYSLAAATGMNVCSKEIQSLMASLGGDSILLPQFSIRVGPSLKGDIKLWPGYEDGLWWVQDASSTLPALVLFSALREKYPSSSDISDLHVIDMCSAPGGKASQLLSVGLGHVTAIEANPRRSRRLMENLKRLDLLDRCEIVVEEGQKWVPSVRPVHGILVDVPCSATGTGARRPDVLRRDSDLKELIIIQQLLANHCADNILDVGGIMVYATCSILKEESEDQIRKLIERGNVETLPIRQHEVPGFEGAIDDNGWLRVLPGLLEGDLRSTDGFFVARLIRSK